MKLVQKQKQKGNSDTSAKTAASKGKHSTKGDMPVVEELEKFKRDNSAMPDYYKAWDKFGAELDAEENEANTMEVKPIVPPEPLTQADMMKRTSGAAPNTSMVVRGGLRKQFSVAEQFKQQGNSYFVSLEYSLAIDQYTKCIRAIEDNKSLTEDDNEMKKIVFSNRAQSYIKLKSYSKAYADACKALE